MGNRGNVVFVAGERISPATYLHWNGGPDSIYPFIAELDRRKVRADGEYEAARFVQIVGEMFDYAGFDEKEQYGHLADYTRRGDCLSLGIVPGPKAITVEEISAMWTDLSDNGVYVVERQHEGGPKVRRFLIDYEASRKARESSSDKWVEVVQELTPTQVEAERREAAESPYAEQFAAFYAELDRRMYSPFTGQRVKAPARA